MQVRAIAKDVGVSPLKMRLLVDAVRGRKVEDALNILRFTPSPAARVLAKAINSAAANAENNYQMSKSDLRVVRAFADQGRMLKRGRARARGRPSPILRHSSHITIVVEEETK
ncbi:MAG: 50S ribosomal protein L22 [Chloroflexi bacterium]|nr:50S ribosomal protein L22 [Chloroflexota bacterium]